MYRIDRCATLKNASYAPKAIGWAKEFNVYINQTYKGFDVHIGVEMFGKSRLHWSYKADTLAQIEEANAKMLQDKKYWAMIETAKEFWVDGSLQDTIIMLAD